jgi:cardiolipin synthase
MLTSAVRACHAISRRLRLRKLSGAASEDAVDWVAELGRIWQYLVAGLTILMSVVGAGHALLYKRDSRAAALWVGFIWLVPLIGALLYFVLGVNRIRRRAVLLRGEMERYQSEAKVSSCPPDGLDQHLPPHARHLSALAQAVHKIVLRPLVPGNRIEPLRDGDAAYPAMLEAIAGSRHSLSLSTYIFDRDEAGLAFARALGEAARRGVQVRVLIDATGTRYSWPPILGVLRREGVRHARFMPTFPLWRLVSINLRNHRKILVADGRLAFTGGMNIRIGHWLEKQPRAPVQDLQFRVEGPVVAQLQEVFADDWLFTTGEALRGEPWFPSLAPVGPVIARGISDGPDEDLDKLRWTLLAALAAARESIRIATPYFLPDPALISALNVAAMRGVEVDILLPARSNLPLVQWASQALWWQLLERGCRLWLSPPPFDHSKIYLVDDCWTLAGSANWDARSLRLNFEFNLECYDAELAAKIGALFQNKLSRARRLTLAEVDARSVPIRLRDGVARLLTPFL